MGGESPKQSPAAAAVFLSYASQDADAARRICDALRAAGIEVWFDQSELRGGDAWDQSIRKQIKNCALFVPIISRHTHERTEGYFRLEWKLAVDRCHLMAADRAFLVPIVVDATPDDDERVPDRFREVQWTRLPGGETPPEFVARIGQLLSGKVNSSLMMSRGSAMVAPVRSVRFKPAWLAGAAIVAALVGYLFIAKPWVVKLPAPAAVASPAAFSPPPHSVAVLPFVNMSGDREQEYFSDGLSEELLNDLARINDLQVAARTSAFSFKGTNTDIGTIARKLNVGAVLEGSVRRSAHTVRVTAQLINSLTGFHMWSQTYDRDLGDVLRLQTEIAAAVTDALKVTLLSVKARVELGGTRNPEAFDAYLHALKVHRSFRDARDLQAAIADYTEALRLDPNYALAYAARSRAFTHYAGDFARGAAGSESFSKAQSDARRAIASAPDLAEGHLALALFFKWGALDFPRAMQEYERALELAPNNAEVLGHYGLSSVQMGRTEAGISATGRAILLDPLNEAAYGSLGEALLYARRYEESQSAFQRAATIDADTWDAGFRGLAYYGLGKYQDAVSTCETKPDNFVKQTCRAVAYDKLGRRSESETVLMMMKAESGDSLCYHYTEIYAQRGDIASALKWVDVAFRSHDAGLPFLKVDPLLDPLRNEPRFQAVMRELRFPD